MGKYLLTAVKATPRDNSLQFHATMSLDSFKKEYTDGSINLLVNPKVDSKNSHPKKLFISFHNADGEQFSGSVSHKILSAEDITDPVVSIVTSPEEPDNYRVLLHNAADAEAVLANSIAVL